MHQQANQCNAKPRVSVVIPVYNRERFIGDAIESVLSQETEFTFEVIVSDNGSQDRTATIAQSFGEPVRVVVTHHIRNAAAARNAGVRAARAPIIALLDSDDLMLPGRLQAQLTFLDEYPSVALVIGAVHVDRGETAEGYFLRRGIAIPSNEWSVLESWRPLIVARFFGAPSTLTMRTSLLEQIGLFNERLIGGEDRDFLFRAASATPIGCYNAPVAWMRTTHEDRLGPSVGSAMTTPLMWEGMLRTDDLSEGERADISRQLQDSVRTALSVTMNRGELELHRELLDRYAHMLDPFARIKWQTANRLPRRFSQRLAVLAGRRWNTNGR